MLKDEVVVFSWITYRYPKDRDPRRQGGDERQANHEGDGDRGRSTRRLIYGGFAPMMELTGGGVITPS